MKQLDVDALMRTLRMEIGEAEEELELQRQITAAPGNPYITGLGGKLSGLRIALNLIERSVTAAETQGDIANYSKP